MHNLICMCRSTSGATEGDPVGGTAELLLVEPAAEDVGTTTRMLLHRIGAGIMAMKASEPPQPLRSEPPQPFRSEPPQPLRALVCKVAGLNLI
jgi:hypothetical protein